jgi:NitT/TauT family transport system permease protein
MPAPSPNLNAAAMFSRALPPFVLLRIGIIVAILALWEIAPRAGWMDAESFPPISEVVSTLFHLFGDPRFVSSALATASRVLVAFIIAAPIALALGIVIGETMYLERAVSPYIYLAMAVPQSIFLPIFIFAFGIGFVEKVVYGATHVLLVVLVNTIAAVRSVPSSYVLAARSFGATPAQIYCRFYIPSMVPYLMTGLRLGLILDVIGVLVAEMYASQDGLGQLILHWSEAFRMKEMLGTVVLISVCTIVINEALRSWEMHLGRWRTSANNN